jgi:uncharacterized protein
MYSKQRLILFEKVRLQFANDTTGHDWFHIERVVDMALYLQKGTSADKDIVEIAALLHDIADHKFHENDFEIGGITASTLLLELGYPIEFAEKVASIIRQVSFKGAGEIETMDSLEGKIVQDADRLDAIGAIGIARTFSFGGANNQPLFLPNHPPTFHNNKEDYANHKSHTINHFYEKLLLIRDRMNTKKGKEIAIERHKILEVFLTNFFKEWDFKTQLIVNHA